MLTFYIHWFIADKALRFKNDSVFLCMDISILHALYTQKLIFMTNVVLRFIANKVFVRFIDFRLKNVIVFLEIYALIKVSKRTSPKKLSLERD